MVICSCSFSFMVTKLWKRLGELNGQYLTLTRYEMLCEFLSKSQDFPQFGIMLCIYHLNCHFKWLQTCYILSLWESYIFILRWQLWWLWWLKSWRCGSIAQAMLHVCTIGHKGVIWKQYIPLDIWSKAVHQYNIFRNESEHVHLHAAGAFPVNISYTNPAALDEWNLVPCKFVCDLGQLLTSQAHFRQCCNDVSVANCNHTYVDFLYA